MSRLGDAFKWIFRSDETESFHNRTKARRSESAQAQKIEDEEALWDARKSFEGENNHAPTDEQYYSCPGAILAEAIERHRRALNRILSFDELLDPYIEGLRKNPTGTHEKRIMWNFLTKFPGIRATMDKIREEVEEELKNQNEE